MRPSYTNVVTTAVLVHPGMVSICKFVAYSILTLAQFKAEKVTPHSVEPALQRRCVLSGLDIAPDLHF